MVKFLVSRSYLCTPRDASTMAEGSEFSPKSIIKKPWRLQSKETNNSLKQKRMVRRNLWAYFSVFLFQSKIRFKRLESRCQLEANG